MGVFVVDEVVVVVVVVVVIFFCKQRTSGPVGGLFCCPSICPSTYLNSYGVWSWIHYFFPCDGYIYELKAGLIKMLSCSCRS